MRIEVFLKTDEGGCEFSKHFEKEFIKNDKLHPFVKSIELKYGWYKSIKYPEVIVYNNIENIVYRQKGNQVNPNKLQQFILKELN